MSYSLQAADSQTEVSTPAGHVVTLQVMYTLAEKRGVSVLVAAAGISLFALLGLLLVLGILSYRPQCAPNAHRFMRTHVAAYFVSLLLCDVIATIGSLMNGQWISNGAVHLSPFCTTQGALKNAGNVGTSMWSLVISIHTFCLLVLKRRSNDYVLYATLFVVWLFIGLVVIIGPLAVQNLVERGPYFGVSGYWCWITDGYPADRLTLEYFWMFLSAFVSFVLYSLVFLSLRGNIVKCGRKLRFRFRSSISMWQAQTGRDSADAQAIRFSKHMLAYPIAHTIFILPIAVCRFLEWSGHYVPFEATIFADTVFMLSGLGNVILFTTTRSVLSARDALPLFSRSRSTTPDLKSQKEPVSFVVTPFAVSEKVSVPFASEFQVAAVPVTVPVPAMSDPRTRRPLPRRKPPYVANSASIKSRDASHGTIGPTLPEPAVLKSRTLVTPPDERDDDLGRRDSSNTESTSRYSVSSYSSTSPLRDVSVVSRTQHPSQNTSALSLNRGTPF